jgi:Na+-transporting NADH:ubiquinone oxidoreductase subunit NqrF
MCAEKDPFDCHRFALVSRGLVLKGQHVRHILADGKVIEQADIEKRLLQKYKGDYDQMDLFAGVSSREEALSEAYAMRGKDIAYAGVKNEGW